MEKQELLAQAEVIRKETQDYANDANRIGKMFEDIINSIPLSVDFSQLNSLNKPESCGRYVVKYYNEYSVGVLDIMMPYSSFTILQRFISSADLTELNKGNLSMHTDKIYTYDRFYNLRDIETGGISGKTWSKWNEAYDLNNFAKSVKWSGEIVNDVTISPNSYTGDDGTVVLVGNYTFAYKVISGGNTIYYGNWHGREDYQKNIYQSGTIGWKAGFYDYLLYVSPTSVWMKKSDSELVNISSEGSGEGSNALLLGDINSLTDSSTSSQIATALNNKTLAELQDAVRNGASIQFVGDYGVVDVIHKDQSSGQLAFGFIYTDEPVYAPYMSKIIALEYTNGNWTCKVREDVNLSSGGSGTSDKYKFKEDLMALSSSNINQFLGTYTEVKAAYDAKKSFEGIYADTVVPVQVTFGGTAMDFTFVFNNNRITHTVGISSNNWSTLKTTDVQVLTSSNVQNNLTTTNPGFVLDARQGKALKDLIDAGGGSGGSDNTIYLKNIQNLEDASTHDQILAVLNGNSFLDMYRKIQDSEKISIVSLGSFNTLINQATTSYDTNSWKILLYYIYTDDPSSAPYMTRNVWLSYNKVSSQLSCEVVEELQFQMTTQAITRDNLPTGSIIKDKLIRGGNHTIPTGFYLNGLEVYGSFLIGSVSYSYYAKAKNIVNGVNLLTDVALTGSGAPTIMLITCEFNYDDNHVGWVDSALQIVDIGGTTLTPTSVVHYVDVEYIKS